MRLNDLLILESVRKTYLSHKKLKKSEQNIDHIAKMWADLRVKLYDVSWTKGEYHIIADRRSLEAIKEFDRARKPLNTPEIMAELTEKLKKEGFTIPVHVTLSRLGKKPVMTEGNHRIVIAKKLGIKKIPVVFFFNEYS